MESVFAKLNGSGRRLADFAAVPAKGVVAREVALAETVSRLWRLVIAAQDVWPSRPAIAPELVQKFLRLLAGPLGAGL